LNLHFETLLITIPPRHTYNHEGTNPQQRLLQKVFIEGKTSNLILLQQARSAEYDIKDLRSLDNTITSRVSVRSHHNGCEVRTNGTAPGHFECHNGTKPRRRYVQYRNICTIEILAWYCSAFCTLGGR
jgi:hypothetical protein